MSAAEAHINERLTNDLWVREYRDTSLSKGKFATWHMIGNNRLTKSEIERLRQVYLEQGWTEVEFYKPSDAFTQTNWAFRFRMALVSEWQSTTALRWHVATVQ